MALKLEELNHVELAQLPRDRTVVFLPVAPIEEHGPHLPYGVDPILSQYFCEHLADRLAASHKDWSMVLHPTLWCGSDTLKYLGSIEVKQILVRELVYAVASKFAADGFKYLVVLGAHGGPRHIVALEEAAAKISWRYRLRGARMLAPLGGFITNVLSGRMIPHLEERMRALGTPLTDEERGAIATDYHAGMMETSIMMVVRPDLVKPQYKDLKPAIVDKFWKIRPSSGQTVGGGFGHLGSPHLARPEIGRAAIDVLLDELTPVLERFVAGDRKVAAQTRSLFYYIPIYRPMFVYAGFLAASLVVFYALMAYFMTFTAGMFSNQ